MAVSSRASRQIGFINKALVPDQQGLSSSALLLPRSRLVDRTRQPARRHIFEALASVWSTMIHKTSNRVARVSGLV